MISFAFIVLLWFSFRND